MSSKKPKAPSISPAEYRAMARDYLTWKEEINKGYQSQKDWYTKSMESDIGRAKSRLASSGVKVGSEGYNRVISEIEKEYSDKLSKLEEDYKVQLGELEQGPSIQMLRSKWQKETPLGGGDYVRRGSGWQRHNPQFDDMVETNRPGTVWRREGDQMVEYRYEDVNSGPFGDVGDSDPSYKYVATGKTQDLVTDFNEYLKSVAGPDWSPTVDIPEAEFPTKAPERGSLTPTKRPIGQFGTVDEMTNPWGV